MVFQPIEESSRGVFSRLLGAPNSSTSTSIHNKDARGKSPWQGDAALERRITLARTYLVTILRLYGLLSMFIICIGPSIAPILLGFVAGRQWAATSAASVLSVYSYYIPLLAMNGILEAFVSSVASSATLRAQSWWMLWFTAGFAVASYLLLKVYELGAQGLIWANGVNMLMRILWSGSFVRGYFSQQSMPLGTAVAPRKTTIAICIGTAWGMRLFGHSLDGSIWNLVRVTSIAAAYGITM